MASQSLRANLVTHDSGVFLRAGAHQFASLWTRDFAYAVAGLCAIGERAAAEHHLAAVLARVSPDGLVPRLLDRGSSVWTVTKWTLLGVLQTEAGESADWRGCELKPEYAGEHGTRALDAGLLVLLAAFSLENPSFAMAHAPAMKNVLGYYQGLSGGWRKLIEQDAFEDWQDSARRTGVTSFVNLLALWSLHHARDMGWASNDELERFAALFDGHFSRVEGLIPLRQNENQIALETQLHAIEMGFQFPSWRPRAENLWKHLKASRLWLAGLGLPVHPPYESDQVSFFAKAAGLGRYHDGYRWTWLIAETGRIALMMNDLDVAETCARELSAALGPRGICEILEPSLPRSARTWIYRSEEPFSWGAARVV